MNSYKTTKLLKGNLGRLFMVLCCLGMIFNCQTDQEQVAPTEIDLEQSKANKSSKLAPGTMINLEGTLNYSYYAVKSKEVLTDVTYECEAIIEILDHNEVTLNVVEYSPDGVRAYPLPGKLTHGGHLKVQHTSPVMVLPDGTGLYMTDIIEGHLGCSLTGPGIEEGVLVFNGKFNGVTLNAPAEFMAHCGIEWPANNLFDTPVDGPVKCKWEFNFDVVE